VCPPRLEWICWWICRIGSAELDLLVDLLVDLLGGSAQLDLLNWITLV
jgi:hypothetical protein